MVTDLNSALEISANRRVKLASVSGTMSGEIIVNVSKQIVDGETVIYTEPHIHRIAPEIPVEDGLAELEAYLALNGWPMLTAKEQAKVVAIAGLFREEE